LFRLPLCRGMGNLACYRGGVIKMGRINMENVIKYNLILAAIWLPLLSG